MIQNWKNEFETIKNINRISGMTNNINTPKQAKEALFAMYLQEEGQSTIDAIIADFRANKTFTDPKVLQLTKKRSE